MALHGDIRINGIQIIVWGATRTSDVDAEGRVRYRCEVRQDLHVRRFDVWHHRTDDNATELAALVLGHRLSR